MILTDAEILKEIDNGNIVIKPFRKECLGCNSYDVHLGSAMATYKDDVIDSMKENGVNELIVPKEGLVLQPGELYLGVTEEYTETLAHVPFLEGKSSIGRLGIDIHATAGKGDIGFKNYWTLEISVTKPVKVYPGMPIGQLIYFQTKGEVLEPYNVKKSAKYVGNSAVPVASKLFTDENARKIIE